MRYLSGRRSSRRRGLGWWLALGAAILAACVAAVLLALLGSVAGLQSASAGQQIAGREVSAATSAKDHVFDMETALRGFAFTPDAPLLARYDAAGAGFARDMTALTAAERLDRGVLDPPTGQIARQARGYERAYAAPLIRLATERQLSRQEVQDATEAGQRRLDALDLVFARQTAFSSGEARRRQVAANTAARSTSRYAIAGSALLVLLIAGFALALRRGIALPLVRLRGAAEQLARGTRSARMPRSRLRELDEVSRSFDSMADALTDGREALVHQNHDLEARVRERTRDLESARVEILTRLARAAEFRDNATHEHTDRVARIARLLGRTLGLTTAEADLLVLAAPLHDIGKIGIPDAVLLKPGKLTREEFDVMKTHSQLGADMLAGSDSPVLQLAAEIALSHHERWDGTGYPQRLHADQIPLAARIVAVADVLDALTQERPYKPPWPLLDALHEITDQSARQFDPLVVDALNRLDHGQLLPRGADRQLEPTYSDS
jgi:HD-GYP domain-containing protein (c-di-GMP phosphodiesterase class II)/CHASE3 domain sensor protein